MPHPAPRARPFVVDQERSRHPRLRHRAGVHAARPSALDDRRVVINAGRQTVAICAASRLVLGFRAALRHVELVVPFVNVSFTPPRTADIESCCAKR